MSPNRWGVSDLTETMAAPGLMLRYSSAISSAGVLERTTLATSLSARRRSACSASSIPSKSTVGFDIVLRRSANEPNLAGGATVRESRPERRPFLRISLRRLLHCSAAVVGMPATDAAEKEKLDVVRVIELVLSRKVGGVMRCDGLGQVRRHHHQELGLVALVADRPEQRAEDRYVAEQGDLADRRLNPVGQQAGDREALTVGQPHGRLTLSGGETRDRGSADGHRPRRVDVADLGRQLEVKRAIGDHRGGEVQDDAELLPQHGDGTQAARDRDGKLAADQKLRLLAGERHQRRFGQHFGEATLLEDVQDRAERKGGEAREEERETGSGRSLHRGRQTTAGAGNGGESVDRLPRIDHAGDELPARVLMKE